MLVILTALSSYAMHGVGLPLHFRRARSLWLPWLHAHLFVHNLFACCFCGGQEWFHHSVTPNDGSFNALPSLNRLLKSGIGTGMTRTDHRNVSDQLYAKHTVGLVSSAMRSKILFAETFDSEDTPSPDNFIQKSRKNHRRVMPRDDDDDGDEFAHGDLEAHAMGANIADYSIHQFIAPDQARDPMRSDDSEQDAAHNDAMRSKISSAETVGSEDTPPPDKFIQKPHQVHRRMMPRDDDDDGVEFEHGDLEDHAMDHACQHC